MSHAPSSILNRRLQIIRREMVAHTLDALVVTALPNVVYLTNFGGSSGIVLLTPDRVRLITDFRYLTTLADSGSAVHECPGLETVRVESSYDETLADTLVENAAERAGFEAAHVSVSRHTWLKARLDRSRRPVELVPTSGIVERARTCKDEYELGILREAARRLSGVAERVFAIVRAGMTERALAIAIEGRIREAGFERLAFETIVASGPQAALPHARPSGRILTEGDVVVLDFGGVYDSYCVDLTRTVCIGSASGRAREVHAAVLDAHDRAVVAVKPGTSRFDIDGAARAALARAGMGEAFGHGTGHGLGLEVHEDPRIVRRRADSDVRDEAVAASMVFTIEPGAYFPGWGGVRIEDDVVVTETGVELLTQVTTDLLEL
jgi:Xaa-Pro aminopeptidase